MIGASSDDRRSLWTLLSPASTPSSVLGRKCLEKLPQRHAIFTLALQPVSTLKCSFATNFSKAATEVVVTSSRSFFGSVGLAGTMFSSPASRRMNASSPPILLMPASLCPRVEGHMTIPPQRGASLRALFAVAEADSLSKNCSYLYLTN